MTFHGGGRSCIGFKFSQLETSMSAHLLWSYCDLHELLFAEVVLNVLLQSFKFSPSRKANEVHWNVAAFRYPTVGKDSVKPELPLKVQVL